MIQTKDKALLEKISIVLKQLRLTKNLTQNEVYLELGIHIGRIESCKVNISIVTLSTICNYFDITLLEFFKKMETV